MEDELMTTDHALRSLARALISLMTMAILIIGVPVALTRVARAQFGGAFPWSGIDPPRRWSLAQVADVVTSRTTDSMISDVLVRASLTTVWVAVAVLVGTVVAEVVHQVRHDGIALPSLRGLGWGQPVARFIATGLLVLTPLFGSRVSAAPTLPLREVAITTVVGAESVGVALPDLPVRHRAHVDDGPTPTTDSAGADPSNSYVVVHGDSVYAIAERLGSCDGAATLAIADRILDRNLGSVMPDGQRFTNAAYIEPGWVLELPSNDDPRPSGHVDVSSLHHLVTPGDTLSSIAEAHFGQPQRWSEVWDLNAGRKMSDGRTFHDPHLIIPGWELMLPTAEVVAVEADEAVDQIPAVDSESEEAVAIEHDDLVPVPGTTTLAAPTPLPGPKGSTSTPSTLTPSSPTSSTVPPLDAPGGPEDAADEMAPKRSPAPIGLGQAAMLSAGLLTLIAALRGRRLRSARPGARVPAPRPESVATERCLRALDTMAVADRLLRVDLALRCVAAEVSDRDRQVLAALVASDGSVEVLLSGPCDLAPPWAGRAERWTLSGDVPVEALAPTARTVGAPCLAMVHLGVSADGRDLHLDLEALGMLAVDAPPARADEVIAGVAATLASSPFAEVARLVGAGVPATAFVTHRFVDVVSTIDEALELADELLGTTSDLEQTTFAARSRQHDGEAWEPVVVLIGSAAVTPRSSELDVTAGRGLAVVIAGNEAAAQARLTLDGDRWRFSIGDDASPVMAVEVAPVGLTHDDLRKVDELVADASMPLEVDDRQVTEVVTPPAIMTFAESQPSRESPEVHSGGHTPSWSIMVRLLGPVDVVDADGNDATFEKSKARELVAWLATHRDRPTRTGARTALWDLDVRDATFANVVSVARRTMARLVPPPVGQEWLARTQTEQLPLHGEVISDADLLADRLEASRGVTSAAAVELLEPAVGLVRGMPFEGTSYLWPDADGLSSNLVLLATTAAAELARHHLHMGDVQGVFRATGQGLLALPGHEELIALRMRAHACAGDHAGVRHEWESYERVVTSDPWSDGEPAPKLVELRRELLTPSK
jgi:hypothetical protein